MLNNITSPDQIVTSVVGQVSERQVRNTKVLFVSTASPTAYLPSNSCSRFISLKKFEIESNYLKEVSRSVFSGCIKIESVNIYASLITRLPEDVFADLKNLVQVLMKNNKISFLPLDLFKENQNLDEVNFDGNRLTVINTIMPKTLKLLSFKSNICINRKSSESVDSMIEELHQNCKDLGLAKEKTALESRINELEHDLVVQKSDNSKTLKNHEANLTRTLTQKKNCDIKTAELETDFNKIQKEWELISDKMDVNHEPANENMARLIARHNTNHESLRQEDEVKIETLESSFVVHKLIAFLVVTLITILSIGWIVTAILYLRNKKISYRVPDPYYSITMESIADENVYN